MTQSKQNILSYLKERIEETRNTISELKEIIGTPSESGLIKLSITQLSNQLTIMLAQYYQINNGVLDV